MIRLFKWNGGLKVANLQFLQKAVFAFNIWDIYSAKAVMDAAAQMQQSIILQTSASLYKDLDQKLLEEFVHSYAKKQKINCWLQLDHCKDTDMIQNAISCGWDSVMFDASDKNIDENIRLTNQVAKIAHGKGVLVEAEIGQIKGSEDSVTVQQEALADKRDIDKFLAEAEADMIAVAFGNAHGMYQGEPELHYDLIEYTTAQTDLPFVVHGGSGLKDSALKKLLSIPQVKKINISTDVKLAHRNGIIYAYKNGILDEHGFQPIKLMNCTYNEIVKMVKEKLNLLIN